MMTSWVLLLLSTSIAAIEATAIDDLATAALKGAAHQAEVYAKSLHDSILKEHKTTEANKTTAVNRTTEASSNTLTGTPLTAGLGRSQLYDFSQFVFTQADATGRFGPTLEGLRRDRFYRIEAWTQVASFLNMAIQGVQIWTVPVTGYYDIYVGGARGGSTDYYPMGRPRHDGGAGIRIHAPEVPLVQGEHLYIVVGQRGLTLGPTYYAVVCGGGGATFVFSNNGVVKFVAAGGGGASIYTDGENGNPSTGASGGNPGGSGGTSHAFAQGGKSYPPPGTGSQGGISTGGDGASACDGVPGAGGAGGGGSLGSFSSSYIGGKGGVSATRYPAYLNPHGGFGGGGGGGGSGDDSSEQFGGSGGGGGLYGGGGGDASDGTIGVTAVQAGSGGGGASYVADGITATEDLSFADDGYVYVRLL